MEDYIDPWLGLWVAIFLWGFWFYLVTKAAKGNDRIKVSIVEIDHGYQEVKVYRMTNGQWELIAEKLLLPGQSVADYVQKVTR